MSEKVRKQIQGRQAHDVLEAGIAELRLDDHSTAARMLIAAAAAMYSDAGDTFNAGVARNWLENVRRAHQ